MNPNIQGVVGNVVLVREGILLVRERETEGDTVRDGG